jgi:hemolysin D
MNSQAELNHKSETVSQTRSRVGLESTPIDGTIVDPLSEELGIDWAPVTRELIDGLPQVWVRGLFYLLILMMSIALPWAIWFRVDETGAAQGRLEPQGRTYLLDAQVSGKVTAIAAKEGSIVRAGQMLLSLDSELVQSDLKQAEAKLEGQLNRLNQLQQIKNQAVIAQRAQKLQGESQISEQRAQISQVEQQLQASQREYELSERRLEKDLEEVKIYWGLSQEGAASKAKFKEVQRAMDESERVLAQNLAAIQQAKMELAKQQESLKRIEHTAEVTNSVSQRQINEVLTQISDLQTEIAQTRQLAASLGLQFQQRTIKSPVTGVVFALPIPKPGAVLQPGQRVAEIAPLRAPLIFRAQMPISQSGFLQVGMPVKLEFDAFNSKDYGIVPARLTRISPTSKVLQTPQGNVDVYELEITLEQTCILVGNRCVSLTPGQTAKAEVIIRQRRVIDFILDPFKKLQGGFKL